MKSGNDKANSSQSTSSGEKKDVKAASATKEQILADLPGITVKTYHREPNHTHVEGNIDYDASPALSVATHNQNWAECTGVGLPERDRQRERRPHARARRRLDHLQP